MDEARGNKGQRRSGAIRYPRPGSLMGPSEVKEKKWEPERTKGRKKWCCVTNCWKGGISFQNIKRKKRR